MTLQRGYKPSVNYTPYLILIGVAIGCTLFGLWYFQVEPAYGYLNPLMTQVITFVQTLISPFASAIDYIKNAFMTNPLACITAVIGIGSVLYGLYSKIKTSRLEQEAQETMCNQAINYENQLYEKTQQYKDQEASLEELKQKLALYEESSPTDLLKQYESTITEKNAELTSLRGQITALNNVIADLKVKVKETTVVK